jgi:hypothetical protein
MTAPAEWVSKAMALAAQMAQAAGRMIVMAGGRDFYAAQEDRNTARAALLDLLVEQARDAPPGYVLVPIEPTPEMIAAMAVVEVSGSINKRPTIGMSGAVEAYAAMLDAAMSASPPPEQEPQ